MESVVFVSVSALGNIELFVPVRVLGSILSVLSMPVRVLGNIVCVLFVQVGVLGSIDSVLSMPVRVLGSIVRKCVICASWNTASVLSIIPSTPTGTDNTLSN